MIFFGESGYNQPLTSELLRAEVENGRLILNEDTDHCYSVIEERFAEYIDEEEVVDVNLLEDGDHRDGIDSRDERREDEHFEEREVHGEEMVAVHPEEGQAWKPIQIINLARKKLNGFFRTKDKNNCLLLRMKNNISWGQSSALSCSMDTCQNGKTKFFLFFFLLFTT